MEKRLNKKIESHYIEFKDNIRNKINTLDFSESSKINELLEYIYDYEKLQLQKDDFVKRKRIKNAIPSVNRCNAKRCNGEQCTRRRKDKCEFCGTHAKGTPHGLAINDVTTMSLVQKVEVFVVNIQGIAYYLDNYENVYSTEDILEGKQDPKIVAKYKKEGVNYSIVRFTAP
jgi:hypothetical protein